MDNVGVKEKSQSESQTERCGDASAKLLFKAYEAARVTML
jgi:hypothetical protein